MVGNPRVADFREHRPSRSPRRWSRPGSDDRLPLTTSGGRAVRLLGPGLAVETGSLLELVRGFLGPMEGIFPEDLRRHGGHRGRGHDRRRCTAAPSAPQISSEDKSRTSSASGPPPSSRSTRSFARSASQTCEANLVGGRLFLEGSVGSEQDMNKATGRDPSLRPQGGEPRSPWVAR